MRRTYRRTEEKNNIIRSRVITIITAGHCCLCNTTDCELLKFCDSVFYSNYNDPLYPKLCNMHLLIANEETTNKINNA